jgi:hypothetical protein
MQDKLVDVDLPLKNQLSITYVIFYKINRFNSCYFHPSINNNDIND